MLRISTTTVESYRRYMALDYVQESELIASIKGLFIPTKPMKMGSAFHSILEKPGDCVCADGYQSDGFKFSAEVINPCLEIFNPAGVFEVKQTRVYTLPSGEQVTVVSKADQLLAKRVIENKTRWSGFDFDSYFDSCQWKFYLDVFEADMLTYNVFCLSENTAGQIKLGSIETFNLFPYPRLHEDCAEQLSKFVDYVHSRGLEPHLQERRAA